MAQSTKLAQLNASPERMAQLSPLVQEVVRRQASAKRRGRKDGPPRPWHDKIVGITMRATTLAKFKTFPPDALEVQKAVRKRFPNKKALALSIGEILYSYVLFAEVGNDAGDHTYMIYGTSAAPAGSSLAVITAAENFVPIDPRHLALFMLPEWTRPDVPINRITYAEQHKMVLYETEDGTPFEAPPFDPRFYAWQAAAAIPSAAKVPSSDAADTAGSVGTPPAAAPDDESHAAVKQWHETRRLAAMIVHGSAAGESLIAATPENLNLFGLQPLPTEDRRRMDIFPRDFALNVGALKTLLHGRFNKNKDDPAPWPTLEVAKFVIAQCKLIAFTARPLLQWIANAKVLLDMQTMTVEQDKMHNSDQGQLQLAETRRFLVQMRFLGEFLVRYSHVFTRGHANNLIAFAHMIHKLGTITTLTLTQAMIDAHRPALRCALTDCPLKANDTVHVLPALLAHYDSEDIINFVAMREVVCFVRETCDPAFLPLFAAEGREVEKRAPAAPAAVPVHDAMDVSTKPIPKKRKQPAAAPAVPIVSVDEPAPEPMPIPSPKKHKHPPAAAPAPAKKQNVAPPPPLPLVLGSDSEWATEPSLAVHGLSVRVGSRVWKELDAARLKDLPAEASRVRARAVVAPPSVATIEPMELLRQRIQAGYTDVVLQLRHIVSTLIDTAPSVPTLHREIPDPKLTPDEVAELKDLEFDVPMVLVVVPALERTQVLLAPDVHVPLLLHLWSKKAPAPAGGAPAGAAGAAPPAGGLAALAAGTVPNLRAAFGNDERGRAAADLCVAIFDILFPIQRV